eukprot:1192479-Prorocentrum_minimum.AAC.1
MAKTYDWMPVPHHQASGPTHRRVGGLHEGGGGQEAAVEHPVVAQIRQPRPRRQPRLEPAARRGALRIRGKDGRSTPAEGGYTVSQSCQAADSHAEQWCQDLVPTKARVACVGECTRCPEWQQVVLNRVNVLSRIFGFRIGVYINGVGKKRSILLRGEISSPYLWTGMCWSVLDWALRRDLRRLGWLGLDAGVQLNMIIHLQTPSVILYEMCMVCVVLLLRSSIVPGHPYWPPPFACQSEYAEAIDACMRVVHVSFHAPVNGLSVFTLASEWWGAVGVPWHNR